MSTNHSEYDASAEAPIDAAAESRVGRIARAARSVFFLVCYFVYVSIVMGLGQRLVVWPLITLLPARRRSILTRWFRFCANSTLALGRWLAGVRVSTRGVVLPPSSCVVVMNHQSVLDIPLGVSLNNGPFALIPTRSRYERGIPGISFLARMGGFPFVHQGKKATREELLALAAAAEQVARGERSLLIYPEGHRTRSGEIGPFMKSGLKLILPRARRPVYLVVGDGAWRARTVADALAHFAHSHVRVAVLGPFTLPEEAVKGGQPLDAFIDELHDRMVAALADLRRPSAR